MILATRAKKFSTLKKLFKYHYHRESPPVYVENDLTLFLKKHTITQLSKQIDEMNVHIGTWKQFKSKGALRGAIGDPYSRFEKFPLKEAKSFKIIKACLVLIYGQKKQ